jgi:hypothetical protein
MEIQRIYLIRIDDEGDIKELVDHKMIVCRNKQDGLAQGIILWAKQITEGCSVQISGKVPLHSS